MTGVLYLADYLGMPMLVEQAKEFIEMDMTLDNAHIYYKDGHDLHQDLCVLKVEQFMVSKICAGVVPVAPKLLEVLTISSMMEVLSSEHILKIYPFEKKNTTRLLTNITHPVF